MRDVVSSAWSADIFQNRWISSASSVLWKSLIHLVSSLVGNSALPYIAVSRDIMDDTFGAVGQFSTDPSVVVAD